MMAENIKSFQASFQMMQYSGYVCVQCKEGYAQVIQHNAAWRYPAQFI